MKLNYHKLSLILIFSMLFVSTATVVNDDKIDLGHVLFMPTDDPFPESSMLTTQKGQGFFALVDNGVAADILVSESDHSGVLRVARLFQKDLGYVSGREAKLITGDNSRSGRAIIAGTLGESVLIDRLMKDGKISVKDLTGKREQFLIIPVKKPFDGVHEALVIVGSDKRGTIFGMFHLSGEMGVSPWYWWADVPVKVRKNIFVKPGIHTLGEPKVKYRGIFINDEAPALTRWAKEKFGGFNHEFYDRVYELILRNKGNYLWPAMWRPSVFATDDPKNPGLADEYGIIISTTHHEPMMRYHEEWSRYDGGEWNYETNKEKLRQFWKEGIERLGDRESVVTVGMRGDGDEAMSEETAVDLMKEIIADQRRIIADVTGKPAEQTPQVWAVYKEVQDYYDRGLRVDDDILVLLCDDNWGNVRMLPSRNERNRKGGYGMYYHFDFVGGPVSYRWINVTQIERVWEQMNLSYRWGVDDLWIVNVGDIKPMELPISFFLDFAWNPDMPATDLPSYYEKWAEQQFGKKFARDIAEIAALYTKYSSRRTPEMLKPDTYSLENYREADRIIEEYAALSEKSKEIYEQMHEQQRSAYYQLIHFPVEISRNLNEMYVAAGKNRLHGFQSRASTNLFADKAKQHFFRDGELTKYYHETLAGGKWNHMMSQTHMGYTNWNNPPVNKMPDIFYIDVPSRAALGYVLEHGVSASRWDRSGLYSRSFSAFDPVNDQTYFVEIFNKGREDLDFSISSRQDWIELSSTGNTIRHEEKVFVNVDWSKVPQGTTAGEIVISGAGQEFVVKVPLRTDGPKASGFVENNGVVSIAAPNFMRKFDAKGVRWTIVPNLGRTGSSLTMEPADAETQQPGRDGPRIEYEFTLLSEGDLNIDAHLSPTLNFRKNDGLKYAIAIDDEPPQIINIHESDTVPDWEYPDWWNHSVTDHIRIKRSVHKRAGPGKHTLRLWVVDPGVVFQKFVIDVGGLRASYLGPPESKNVNADLSLK